MDLEDVRTAARQKLRGIWAVYPQCDGKALGWCEAGTLSFRGDTCFCDEKDHHRNRSCMT